MDRGELMQRILTAAAVLFGTAAYAHPHTDVDQQILMTFGVDQAALTYVIVPSISAGPDVVALIDTDQNGDISTAEADAFAADITAATVIMVNGERADIANAFAILPPVENIESATAPITIKATVPLPFAQSGDTIVTAESTYDAISHDWFIQPFYSRELTGLTGMPTLTRHDATIEISVTSP